MFLQGLDPPLDGKKLAPKFDYGCGAKNDLIDLGWVSINLLGPLGGPPQHTMQVKKNVSIVQFQ